MSNKINLALLISGGGTTASAIIKACIEKKLAINPVLVIASKEGIGGIKKVQETGLPKNKIVVIDQNKCENINIFADRLIKECDIHKVDIVGQYGWLPLTPEKFVNAYRGRIINQHPGPLDPPRNDFGGKGMYGRRVHCAVLYFRRLTRHDFWTEATTHLVTKEFDKGEVIKRQKIEIKPTDTVEDLQQRILPIEHLVQIEALNDFVHHRIKIYKRKKPLIKKTEVSILEEAKKIAKVLYPKR